MLSKLFGGPKIDHPLADPKELRRILSELPLDNAFKALDELDGWFESLLTADHFPDDLRFLVALELEEAGYAHVRRLGRDYLHSPRLSKSEERRLWAIIHGFWSFAAANYERCVAHLAQKDRVAEQLMASLPLLLCRLLSALTHVVKWEQFHYGSDNGALWQRLGAAYLLAETTGCMQQSVKLHAKTTAMTTPTREYVRSLVFSASSMGSLLPIEIDLAERLIAHFLPQFVFGPRSHPTSVMWVDPLSPQVPQRLAVTPASTQTLRFFHAGPACAEAEKLLSTLERGHDIPPEINLGGQVSTKMLIRVLRHLVHHWREVPPQRHHRRHRVKHRMTVLPGFASAQALFADVSDDAGSASASESWVVEDVSQGGFGAQIAEHRDWLKVGALLAMQPEGGGNWLVGIVRRHQQQGAAGVRAGIEVIGRQVRAITVMPKAASSYAATAGVSALWIEDGAAPDEARLILPPASFDVRESLELHHEGKRLLLTPVGLLEHTHDYEIARYRQLTAS